MTKKINLSGNRFGLLTVINEANACFNGACLCSNCHYEFHRIYGKETATINDFSEFCNINTKETNILNILIHSKGREDIEKAIHELQLLLELRYAAN